MSSFKEELKSRELLDVLVQISHYVLMTEFNNTTFHWIIKVSDGSNVWMRSLSEDDMKDIVKVPLPEMKGCIDNGSVRASSAHELCLSLAHSNGTADVRLKEMSCDEVQDSLKSLVFNMATRITSLQKQLSDCQSQLLETKKKLTISNQEAFTGSDLSGSSAKVSNRPKKPAGHSLINPRTKKRKAAGGVVFGEDD
jgi:hypothetical protein